MKTTPVFEQTAIGIHTKRITVSYGGSSSSKSISAMQILTVIAETQANLVFTIVGESKPVIRRSVLRDWKTIIMGEKFNEKRFHGTDLIYTFPSQSIMQFVPADSEDRFIGPRQDYVLIDEASNISEGIFKQLIIRTNKAMVITFNPSHKFWAKSVMDRDDCLVIHSTVKNNWDTSTGSPLIDQAIVDELIRMGELDPNFYDVYFLGIWGTLEGLIYKENVNWKTVKTWPDESEADWIGYGLDFGYSDHASALILVMMVEGELWARQKFWEPGMKTQEIFDQCEDLTNHEDIAADSAEDRLIDELEDLGLNIYRAKKGPGSVKYGTNLIKQQMLNVHEDSLDLIKDFRNYKRKRNRAGDYLDEPVKLFDEGPDAIRYICDHKMADPVTGVYQVR